MTPDDKNEVKDIAELEVRRYFDTYLRDVFPHTTKQMIELHDRDEEAHGGMPKKFGRFFWTLTGIAVGGGAAGGTLAALIKALTGA